MEWIPTRPYSEDIPANTNNMSYMEYPSEWDSQTEEEWEENDKLGEEDTTQETQNAIFDEQEEKTTDY